MVRYHKPMMGTGSLTKETPAPALASRVRGSLSVHHHRVGGWSRRRTTESYSAELGENRPSWRLRSRQCQDASRLQSVGPSAGSNDSWRSQGVDLDAPGHARTP